MISIKTEKVVVPEIEGKARKILEISGVLGKEGLPSEYQGNPEMICGCKRFGKDIFSIKCFAFANRYRRMDRDDEGDEGSVVLFTMEEVYSEQSFQVGLDIIKKAGEILHQINLQRKELTKEWQGEETFLI